MEKQEIHCTIDGQGNLSFAIKGVKGSSCRDLAEVLKRLGRPLAEQRTAEYYQRVKGQARVGVAVKR
jgi:hypothetical protein